MAAVSCRLATAETTHAAASYMLLAGAALEGAAVAGTITAASSSSAGTHTADPGRANTSVATTAAPPSTGTAPLRPFRLPNPYGGTGPPAAPVMAENDALTLLRHAPAATTAVGTCALAATVTRLAAVGAAPATYAPLLLAGACAAVDV
jgi:hypothetical protein